MKQCLENYYALKAALEEICELNQQLLRAKPAAAGKKRRVEMIHLRCSSQPRFVEGLRGRGSVGDLWEPSMRQADQILEDGKWLGIVYEALVRASSEKAARAGASECLPKLWVRRLLLKHLRNWSFDVVEREVRPNLLYRSSRASTRAEFPTPRRLAVRRGHWVRR